VSSGRASGPGGGNRPRIVALAGGVGAARFLEGLVRVVDPADVLVIGNTADDLRWHGLHVSPDLDSVTYRLGGGSDTARGWGRADERYTVGSELSSRYGREQWFTIGDRDLATHLVRSEILQQGGTLSEATAELAQAWRIGVDLRPMSDDPVATVIDTEQGPLGFQQWWVGRSGAPAVTGVRIDGAASARPAPGLLEAIGASDLVVLCPSNPVVSVEPILAIPGLRGQLARARVAGVSPVVGGDVIRGMADRLLAATGSEVSAAGVARRYVDVLDLWVSDVADGPEPPPLPAGVETRVVDTVMRDTDAAASLARTVVDAGLGRDAP